MAFNGLRAAGLSGLLLSLASSSLSVRAAVSCSGISPWVATTTYAAGAQVTYSGSLYTAVVSTTNVPPNYCPACGWWQLVDACGTVVTCSAAPAVPGGLGASGATTSSLNLSWSAVTPPANCSVTYSVFRGGSQVASGLTSTATTISGLSASTAYSFTVAAVDAAGSSAQSSAITASTLAAATCTAAPAVPGGLSASGATTSSLNLSWSAVTTPANCSVTYSVFRGGSQVASGLTSTSTTISGLAASTSYSFTVAAVDAAGSSAQSSAITASTLAAATCTAAPAVPTGLAASGTTASSTNLSWSAVATPANCSVTYCVYRGGSQVASGLTSTSTTISGLAASTAYTFTVAAVDAAGSSAQSGSVAVTTSGGSNACSGVPTYSATAVYTNGMKVVYNNQLWNAKWWTQGEAPSTGGSGVWQYVSDCTSVACSSAPAVPSGLASSNLSTTGVTLTWGAVAAPAGCTVSYKVNQNNVQVQAPSSNSVTLTGLSAGTTYSFTVASVDSVGTSAFSSALSVTTLSNSTCAAAPAVPSGLTSSNVTSSGVNLSWNAVATPANCSVSYTVYQNGSQVMTVPTTTAVLGGLAANTTYSFTVASSDAAGASAQSSALSVKTLPGGTGVTTTGTINFHLLLGVSNTQDKLPLDGDTYTDLMMSNFIAGVMEGRLINEYYPGLQFSKDYLYGSIMGQLLQENLATNLYTPNQSLIDPSPDQQAVMGQGQGGPYQINNYAVDMVNGTYTPAGYAMINFVALQKSIGYTMASAPLQYTQVTPPSFNNKYFSPMLTAYFHYIDFVAMYVTGKGTGGWTTPWEPAFDNALTNFKTLPNNFLEVLLNVGYNQGFYGGLLASYSTKGATANAATVASVRSYTSVWGKTSTYEQYPYQVMYYLDQMYGNPIPTTSATTLVTPGNHVAFNMTTLGGVFSNVFQTLGYVNGSGQYLSISSAQASTAFNSALTSAGVSSSTTLDLSNAGDRAKIFSVLETAIANLETNLGVKFNATTNVQL